MNNIFKFRSPYNHTILDLSIHNLVVGAGDQQEAPHGVGELAVVDLLFMLLLKDPQKYGPLCIPNLRRIGKECMSIFGSHWSLLWDGSFPTLTFLSLEQVASRRSSGE